MTEKTFNQSNTGYSGSVSNAMIMNKNLVSPLLFSSIWEKQESQSFTDLYYLTHQGIPDELRVFIWKALLKTEIIELEGQKTVLKAFPEYGGKGKSLFSKYIELAEEYDCTSFRQIDEDVGRF